MSRSRKNVSSSSDYSKYNTKKAKRRASKAVRRYTGDLADGMFYKKLYCSYNIFDCRHIDWFPPHENYVRICRCNGKVYDYDYYNRWYVKGLRK